MESQVSLRRVMITLTFWVGLVAILSSILFFIARIPVSPAAVLGVGLILWAMNIFLAGEFSPGFISKIYTIKGQLVRGSVAADVGWNDLLIGACENDRVAQVLYGPFGSPVFNIENGEASIALRRHPLNLGSWEALLAPNLLWKLGLVSKGGDIQVDLDSLRVASLDVVTESGAITLAGMPRVFAEVSLKTSQGSISITIPDQMGVDITLDLGKSAGLTVKNERLRPLSLNRYAVPELESQIVLKIESLRGDIQIN